MNKKIFFSSCVFLSLIACKPTDAELEQAVIQTIENNPEIISQALEAQQQIEFEKKEAAKKKAINANQKELEKDGYSLVIGNPEGDVTVVAFKDYRCGFCKRGWQVIKDLKNKDKNVRIVMKEMPILGRQSMQASRLGFASAKQGKYASYYAKLIEHKGPWDEKTLLNLAQSIGLDTKQLKKDSSAEDITQKIQKNMSLARKLGISGTPAFVVGDTLFPGAVELETLQVSIKLQREKKK